MTILHIELPFQNESSSPVKLLLEPLSEYVFVQPGWRVVVHGLCSAVTENRTFTLAPNDTFITVYAPGEIDGFIDCFVTQDGSRLAPDGN